MSGIHKLVESLVPTNLGCRTTLRSDLEDVPPLRDRTTIIEERVVAKGNNRTNIHEKHASSPSSMIKGKLFWTPRTDSVTMLDSSPDVHYSSGAHGGGEWATNLIKATSSSVANNKKRPMSTTSSAHYMAHWAGQRPLKISRTRRANLVSPVSNNDEDQISSQDLTTSELGATTSLGTGGSLLVSSTDNYNPKLKMKLENFPSPPALSEGEKSGGGENRLKEERTDTGDAAVIANDKAGDSILPIRKNKVLVKGETGDVVEGQGRIGRFLSSTKPFVAPSMDQIENLPGKKLLQAVRSGSDKNRSKFGHPPSKKPMVRRTSIRSSGSPDFAGELDDDREELLVAATSARNAIGLACSDPFWKKMEYYFASVTSQDASYLKHQLNFAEELSGSLYQMPGDENNDLGDLMHNDDPIYFGARQESHANQESVMNDAICGGSGERKMFDKASPLYQRVLSALIEEDESEELYLQNEGRNMSFQCASDDSHCGSCNYNDVEPKDRDRMESEVESEVYLHAQHCLLDRISCNKSASSNTDSNRSVSSSVCNNEQCQADDGLSNSNAGLVPRIFQSDLSFPHSLQVNVSPISSSNCQYQILSLDDRLLLELQSIGLYPEIMPHLAEGEEAINQDIMELQTGLFQQVQKMKKNLGKIDIAIPYARDAERRNMEQVAMSKLIEMAYKKRMAARGSHSSKSVVRRVSKQVALAFAKRTLDRCRKFEDTGRSCFSEAALQDIIFSAPPCNTDVKSVDCVGSRTARNRYNKSRNRKSEPRDSATGAVSSTLERPSDFHGDNLQRGSSDKQQAISNSNEPILNNGKKREVLLNDVGSASSKAALVGSAKGKRSKRDRDQNIELLTNNSASGSGHPSVGSFRNDRKSKAKPKQKTSYLSASGNGLQSRCVEATHPASPSARASSRSIRNVSNIMSKKQELLSPTNIPRDSSKEEKELANFSAEQLNELGSFEHEDYSSLLDFDVDGLQDHDSLGLEIPMDSLSDVHLFM